MLLHLFSRIKCSEEDLFNTSTDLLQHVQYGQTTLQKQSLQIQGSEFLPALLWLTWQQQPLGSQACRSALCHLSGLHASVILQQTGTPEIGLGLNFFNRYFHIRQNAPCRHKIFCQRPQTYKKAKGNNRKSGYLVTNLTSFSSTTDELR